MVRDESFGLPIPRSLSLSGTLGHGVRPPSETGLPDPLKQGYHFYVATPGRARRSSKASQAERSGLDYGRRVVGKYLFRVRETHVANHLIPLMRSRALGAAKMDLMLRGIALPAEHAGDRREVGMILPRHSYELMHDLVRGSGALGSDPPDLDASRDVVVLKRKWVGEQLARLEALGLLRRVRRPGRRPRIVVLRDDASGEPFDDPDGTPGNTYVTILGGIVSSGQLAKWGTPELSAFLAAMVGERHDREARNNLWRAAPAGGGKWFRPLSWFEDVARFGPDERVSLGFSVPTLERGVRQLEAAGLLSHDPILVIPGTKQRLQQRRNWYTNNFASLAKPNQVLRPADFSVELSRDAEADEPA
jgi:hypothetical protein